jgi:glycosyltransferase involved in cell wall biosynthesis
MKSSTQNMKTALIVAFHFPPFSGGSGILRILKFCRFLPDSGWKPVVLTASERAYEQSDPTLLKDIPPAVPVIRAFALDTQRHLAFRGRYARWMALPDRWTSWVLSAVGIGLYLIRKHRADVIITTYPIASAVLIGLLLQKLTGRLWVVDFRDSMTEDDYPRDPLIRKIYRRLERAAIHDASGLVFTTRSSMEMYLKRYPNLSSERCLLIPNGYDEEDFSQLPLHRLAGANSRCVRLLHLGVIYPSERDPRPFFRAVARLLKEGRITPSDLKIELRASGNEEYYSKILHELGIADVVQLLPALPYPLALSEAASSDGLLLFQAGNCDHQIPAKAYEYLRLGKPILALTTQTGDTAALFRETGGASIVDLSDENAIYEALPAFLGAVRTGQHPSADLESVRRYDRRNQTADLARALTGLQQNDGKAWRHQSNPATESKGL